MNWFAAAAVVFWIGTALASNYSHLHPRILILGPSKVGKSSLANVLAGCQPSDEDCFSPACTGVESCSKQTSIAEAMFLGKFRGDSVAFIDGNVTLIDSPDTDSEELIAEMIEVLKNSMGQANTILLCFKEGRFNPSIVKVVQELESLFGYERLWKNTVIEVTNWAFDKESIEERKEQGITEEGTMEAININLRKHFNNLHHNLSGVFIDSNAVDHTDEIEKEYFLSYSRDLWELSKAMPPLSFFTIEEIVDQLHNCQENNKCLNQVLEDRISKLETSLENNLKLINANIDDISNLVVADETLNSRIDHVDESVTSNFNSITANTGDINDNAQCINDLIVTDETLNSRIDHVDESVTSNLNSITANTDNINDNYQCINDNTLEMEDNQKQIQTNTDNIATNKNNIETNKNDIDSNTDNIDTNKNNIDTNINNLDINKNNISTNTDNIENNKNKIGTNTNIINTNKNNITINTDNIDINKNNITTNTDNIDTNTNSIDTNKGKIGTNTDSINTNKNKIDTNTEAKNLHISQCGYRYDKTTTGKITYERLVTDVNSLKPKGGLDIETGVFTAPIQGTYLVNIHFYTWDAGRFGVRPYKNNGPLDNFRIYSISTDNDYDSSGRSFSIELHTDDTLHVGITTMSGSYIQRITFCTTLIK